METAAAYRNPYEGGNLSDVGGALRRAGFQQANAPLTHMSMNHVEGPDNGVKIVVTEADLEDYPGMYVLNKQGNTTLEGVWAHYPKEVVPGGYHKLQQIVNGREPYLVC